jgi:hypothetical protein
MKNLTYDQLIKLAPKDRPFQIETDTLNPSWAYITDNDLWTIFQEYTRGFWKNDYKGTFTLIDPLYQKPEVLKVGQKVKIMESARECGDFRGWGDMVEDMIGKTFEIEDRDDGVSGVNYLINGLYTVPHYCVMPVEDEEVQEIPELENTLEQLDNLVSKAQDIISKYKKQV